MLFWAGLRGAVGVALASGIQGKNASALRTTVLIVVVLTVVVFGGTTSRMLEVMGIKMGVEDDEASSDEDDDNEYPYLNIRKGSNNNYFNHQSSTSFNDNPYIDEENIGNINLSPNLNIHTTTSSTSLNKNNTSPSKRPPGDVKNKAIFNNNNSDLDDDDDNEILPIATSSTELDQRSQQQQLQNNDNNNPHLAFRDGRWFTELDERYLLPIFSNSVANRRQK